MTFLELCKMVGRYIAVGDAAPGSYPTTTVGAQGLDYEITQWVQDAYSDIQQEQIYWNWKRGRASLTLTAGVGTYSLATIQSQVPTWDYIIPFVTRGGAAYVNVARTSIGVADQTYCWMVPYQDWRGYEDRGVIPSGKPGRFTQQPAKGLEFIATPDTTYTVTCDYRKLLDVLSGDSDTPEMPLQYHEAIAWRACYLWALQRESPNKYEAFNRQYEGIMDKMRREELPPLEWDVQLFYGTSY